MCDKKIISDMDESQHKTLHLFYSSLVQAYLNQANFEYFFFFTYTITYRDGVKPLYTYRSPTSYTNVQ